MRESAIEKKIRLKVERIGGLFLKWNGSVRGVPDRICLLPNRNIMFVELKQKGKKPSKLQQYQRDRIRALGFDVWVIAGPEEAEAFIHDLSCWKEVTR